MASIPLVALNVHPIEQPDALQNIGRIQQLKAMQQEQQQRQQAAPYQQQLLEQQAQGGQLQLQQQQQALKDQQAMTKAMQSWDGKSLDELPTLVIKNGGSAQAVMGLKAKALDIKKTYSDIAEKDATTGTKQLDALKQKNDMVSGALSTVLQAPDEQLPQTLVSTAQQLTQQGLLDPQHAQLAQQIAQGGNPTAIRAQLDAMRKGLLSDSQLLDEAQKKASTASANATAEKTQLENDQMKQYGGLTGPASDAKYRFLQQKLAMGQPISEEDQAYIKGYEKQKLLVPMTSGNLRIEGYAQSRMLPVYDNKQKATTYVSAEELSRAKGEEPGRYTVAAYTPEAVGAKATTNYFTQGKGGQQLTAFNTALVHLNTLDRLAADLNNTDIRVANAAKQKWAEETGNPAPANFAAAVNAMSGEVAAALKASGATDQEIEKAASTFSKTQSPAQLKGAINTYRELLKGKEGQLKKQYSAGMQGTPAFDKEQQPQMGTSPMTITLPSGKKITID